MSKFYLRLESYEVQTQIGTPVVIRMVRSQLYSVFCICRRVLPKLCMCCVKTRVCSVFSGSLLIQQISGNSGPPPLINQVNNSVVIAESAATQSVINSQSQYPPSNTSYLINTQQISSENSTIIDQVQPTPCLIPASVAQPSFGQFPTVSVDEGLQQQSMKSSTVVQMSTSSSVVAPVKRVDADTKSTGAGRTVDEVSGSLPAKKLAQAKACRERVNNYCESVSRTKSCT